MSSLSHLDPTMDPAQGKLMSTFRRQKDHADPLTAPAPSRRARVLISPSPSSSSSSLNRPETLLRGCIRLSRFIHSTA